MRSAIRMIGAAAADGGVAGQQADEEGRQAHDQDGDEEGVLAADEVAEPAEEQRAERTHKEARGEGEQREDISGVDVEGAEELRADHHGERAVKIEIIPFENGAERRGENDPLLLRRHRPDFPCRLRCCHTHMRFSPAMPAWPDLVFARLASRLDHGVQLRPFQYEQASTNAIGVILFTRRPARRWRRYETFV
jgi:hypothetical protein